MAGYIEKSLGQGEEVVAMARFHWWYTFKSFLALVFLGWLLIGFYIFFVRMYRKWTTEIGVTTHRFVEKTGWLTLSTSELALHNIEGVQIKQTFWGRILGYGHLRIEGTGMDAIQLPDIADPIAFRAAIESAKQREPRS
ncbi:MAG: PH domain-containing protein [Alphaproteobacteria bacterium]|nr:PH domain-containing protein [Alphaproteobacteria bacterium]